MALRGQISDGQLSDGEVATLKAIVDGESAPSRLRSTDVVRLSARRLVMADGNQIVPTALGLEYARQLEAARRSTR